MYLSPRCFDRPRFISQPPVITNLPSTFDITEDQTLEQLLYTLTVTDGSLSDRVTCKTESITPTTDNFFVRLIAGTTGKNVIHCCHIMCEVQAATRARD